MPPPRLWLKPKADSGIAAGQVWVFRNDVGRIEGTLADGEPADVLDAEGRFLGRDLASAASKIVCRIFARDPIPIDNRFLRRRIAAAIELRKRSGLPGPATNAFRLFFGESDGIPGLVVDRFGDTLVLAAHTAGIERRKKAIARILLELSGAKGIFERSDAAVRQREGLPPAAGWLAGEGPVEVAIQENHIRYLVDFARGMKTGHFCDQRENRLIVRRLAAGARGLDVFSYTGGFALNMLAGDAASVIAVDQAEEAIDALRRNIALNGFNAGRIELRVGDAFDFFRAAAQSQRRSFDLIVLDPPAFAKDRGGVEGALRGYKEIQVRGLKLLRDGGFLLSCSCTHHVTRAAFREVLRRAAKDTHRRLRLIGEYGQPPDHPVILNIPETDYLEAILVQAADP